MITARALIVFLLGATAVGIAQSTPTLKQRHSSDTERATAPVPTDYAKGHSTLPDNASGEYELDDNGSVVQITIDDNRLSGYITKMNEGSALTLLFQHTTIEGSRVTFTTQTVHEVSYSFTGSVIRGEEESAAKTGYFRLAGDLTANRESGNETKQVSLKSTPRLPHTDN